MQEIEVVLDFDGRNVKDNGNTAFSFRLSLSVEVMK